MKFVPHNQHSRDAYRCEELSLELRRLGREVEAEFWRGVRDAKFNDAINSDSRAKARQKSDVVHGSSGDRNSRGAVGDTARDNGMSNGSTTSNGAHNRNSRK